jgi:hypothetical protein
MGRLSDFAIGDWVIETAESSLDVLQRLCVERFRELGDFSRAGFQSPNHPITQ